MKLSRSTWALLAIAVATLAGDQISKFLVMTRLAPTGTWTPIPSLANFFTLTYTTNTGAAFGLFKDWGPIFVWIAVVVIAAIVIYQSQVPKEAWLVRAALGLQLGGAAGNLIDRLRLGRVIDFIHLHYYSSQVRLDWPVFNVADSAIVTGVILLALTMLREERQSFASASKPSESADSNPPLSA